MRIKRIKDHNIREGVNMMVQYRYGVLCERWPRLKVFNIHDYSYMSFELQKLY